ncbi:hypothetical protein [Staphylococcus felis]|uniref:hypothetical protein n=1 Tax=Staphylococcus felis TaxID=46127 RepID=UPI000E2543A7|nr:hypothetical protein [Staphylococcus felis]REH81957.1 hypothetical protein DOS61_10225 [Staphylococcus felis]REH91398.1 hypothetical protein DOS58_03085 [Staphylococcus felis]
MEKYNRDLYTKGLESYEVPNDESSRRLDLVFGFVAGAILGSALGIILNTSSKSSQIKVNKKKQDESVQVSAKIREEAQCKADNLKEQARKVLTSSLDDNKNEATSDELAAQHRAIRSEVDSDRLEGQTGPTQTAQSEVDKEKNAVAQTTKEETEKTTPVTNEFKTQKKDEPSEASLRAQRRAIQSEVDSDRLEGHRPSQNESNASNQNKHSQAKFENGVITHDMKTTQSDATERIEKKNSKVEKQKFNQ